MAEGLFVADAMDLADGARILVRHGERAFGIYRLAGRLHAYESRCPHQGGPACEGLLMPKVKDVIAADGTYRGQDFDYDEMHIVCPWHGWEFDIRTGISAGDAKFRLRRIEAYEKDGRIYLGV